MPDERYQKRGDGCKAHIYCRATAPFYLCSSPPFPSLTPRPRAPKTAWLSVSPRPPLFSWPGRVKGVSEGQLTVKRNGGEEPLEFGTCVWATGVAMHPLVSRGWCLLLGIVSEGPRAFGTCVWATSVAMHCWCVGCFVLDCLECPCCCCVGLCVLCWHRMHALVSGRVLRSCCRALLCCAVLCCEFCN